MGLLKVDEYTLKVSDYKVVDSKPVLKSIILRPKVDEYEIGGGIMMVMDAEDNKVIEGRIVDKIERIKKYEVKTIMEAMDELKTKIAEDEHMTDWEIDWSSFTKLNIKSIKLKYYESIEEYFIPVYEMKCTYVLEYDGILDYGCWGRLQQKL